MFRLHYTFKVEVEVDATNPVLITELVERVKEDGSIEIEKIEVIAVEGE